MRAELPEELRGQFDAEYHAALEVARASYRLDRLEVIQAWWQLVWARRSPARAGNRDRRRLLSAKRSRPDPTRAPVEARVRNPLGFLRARSALGVPSWNSALLRTGETHKKPQVSGLDWRIRWSRSITV
jgi:hypothetical protein